MLEHGGDIYTEGLLKGKKLIDFSSNINPLGVPESFKNHIGEALENMEMYPDIKYRTLKNYIIEYIEFSKNYFRSSRESDLNFEEQKMSEENIVLGNGAAEVIDLAVSCFKRVSLIVPSFIEYEKSALKWKCDINYSLLDENMSYNYDDIFLKIKESDALIIANPNNPNGTIIDKDKFKEIMDYCEKSNKKIIIDEAFIEFTGKRGCSLLKETEKYKCLFIIKALTKFYAMPGIRFGYGVTSDKDLIKKIEEKQNPWNVNCFAEVAAKYSLKDEEYINNSLNWIETEREFMLSELKKIDFIEKVYDTYGNFVLCKLKKTNCDELYKLCLKQGIVIRKCDNFKGLDKNYTRFAIKNRRHNEIFIETLKDLNL
ncbi:aminotransferase class I/II-fold pyridoxal phosphate-dependent enzyme [Clostridiaceae bacterium UIB06]|uniref:Aminotransferase class I/II-fold pyridoxal phosphate-dependent enzyme n=1 Tax=Clostridium thailandense TaxID=2794346 RepID=A0A949WSM2_9CLOT|nr:histidinol-phosphate transaminase [Clostridium thailandense]MBV7275241.1 aminotransferase class I/II-fold pyridoxal phosphate-dependent enzyme [Clostridium thailandense]MCH5137752.1 aminotransferase class I/II-fold pyridoxal phosphate-dependent enzyme [Clostridiaceae bacterium UIB06]